MEHGNIQLAKNVLNRITTVMSFQEGLLGKKIRWFFSFGTMLEYLCDRTFKFDFDIDIGVFYKEADAEKIIRGFESFGYKCSHQFLHDVDKKPLNLHFAPTMDCLEGSSHC